MVTFVTIICCVSPLVAVQSRLNVAAAISVIFRRLNALEELQPGNSTTNDTRVQCVIHYAIPSIHRHIVYRYHLNHGSRVHYEQHYDQLE